MKLFSKIILSFLKSRPLLYNFFRQLKSGRDFDPVTIKVMQTSPPLRSDQHFKNFMKDVECVELSEYIIKNSTIFFFELWAKIIRKLRSF